MTVSLLAALDELRRRFVTAEAAIAVGSVLGWVEYDRLFNAIIAPLRKIAAELHGLVNINFGVSPSGSPGCSGGVVGVVVASSVWL